MNKKILAFAISALALTSIAKGVSDPVLMTINGEDVRLSEFQYLYNKNNTQQVEPVTFDQYVNMFIDYKLKVADAKAAGIDTTVEYLTDYRKFSTELAEPFLADKAVEEAIIAETFNHMLSDVEVAHIMVPNNPDAEMQLDSIRTAILAGETTFEDAAAEFSVDRDSATKGGKMGWINGSGRLPWEFEKAAYDTPVGQISPVINSGFGYHIVKPLNTRQNQGQVKAEHILVLTQGLTTEEILAKKQRIDSLYNVLKAGADFAELAKKYSEDPGSARRGGDLGWFGTGVMVPEFENTAFSMPVGTISKPFATSYGYHIIHKSDQKGAPTLEQVRPVIEKLMQRDNRGKAALKSRLDKVAQATNAQLNPGIGEFMEKYTAELGGELEPKDMAGLYNIDFVAFTVNGVPTTLGQVFKKKQMRPGLTEKGAALYAERFAQEAYEKALMDQAREMLFDENAEYRNLASEYRDGLMLFDISNKKVWEKATKDKEGLEEYFKANRDKYTFDSPRFKSYVLFATNDSILNEAFNLATNYFASEPGMKQEKLASELKANFGNNVKLEKVIAAKGENPITDFLGFGAAKPDLGNQKWTSYRAFRPTLINAPEEAADIRGTIVADYQTYLEKQWLDQLHKTYPVKVNKKVLEQARKLNK